MAIEEALNYSSKYCYKGTNILINNFDIKEANELQERESLIATYKLYLLGLDECPDKKNNALWKKIKSGSFDIEHYKNIHKFIFGDIYPFAGIFRIENIQKGNTPFCRPEFLTSQINFYLTKMKKDILLVKTKEDLINFLSYYFGELNLLHPFREGNGRSEREFMKEFIEKYTSYTIDYSLLGSNDLGLDRNAFLQASIDSVYGNYKLFNEIFNILLVPKQMNYEETKKNCIKK